MTDASADESAAELRSSRPHQALGPGAEFDTIRLLMARWGDLAVDIGDDAAVLRSPTRRAGAGAGEGAEREIVVSTDACLDGAHFRSHWIRADEIGARAVAAALSDLAAMGARAEAVLLSFAVPEAWRSRLGDVADGVARVLRPTGARIIGGNLSRSSGFGITTTVIGSASRAVARRGALVGDVLLVTGTLGGPGQAVKDWDAGRTPSPWARERFAAPTPRLAEGQALAEAGVHAMLDISDGLVADARHLAASGVRLRIDASRVPLGPGVRPGAGLASGEEYELLVAASPDLSRRLRGEWANWSDVPFTAIGKVVSEQPGGGVEIVGLLPDDNVVEFVHGHDHFSG